MPRPAIANVEANEFNGPFIYLYRSFVPDTGGPGTMRGGAGTSLAIAPYHTDELHAVMLVTALRFRIQLVRQAAFPADVVRTS